MCVPTCEKLIYRIVIFKNYSFGMEFNISETVSHKNMEIMLNKIFKISNLLYSSNFKNPCFIKEIFKNHP